ncbi:MAG: hypothetical protein ACKE8R_08765 [Methylophagaceae bacterium]
MSNKGFFASICSFFGGLFSSDSDQSSNTSDGLTSVERYIRSQSANTSSNATSVDAYIQENSKPVTTVEAYIRNLANAKPATSVEQYIRNNG